jgi:uncharacterized protein YifN (PemK superfamily)
MGILKHQQPGTIVRVDLNTGFRYPEMEKRRPCVIISKPIVGREQLCTIVPISTREPGPTAGYCQYLTFDPRLPEPYAEKHMWAKCDMVMTVAFHRLQLLHAGKDENGDRLYDVRVLSPEILAEIRQKVALAVGL